MAGALTSGTLWFRIFGRRGHMAELVDALVSGTSGAIHGGSSPFMPTNF